jgi:membrane protein required for colicin V production
VSAAGIGWVDWAFLAVIGLSMLVGVLRGLVVEVMSLLGWVVAYVAAQLLGAAFAPSVPIGAPGSWLNLVASYVVVFVVVLLLWRILTWLIGKLMQASPLQPVDRVLGAGFGFARGLLIALLVATIVNLTPLAQSSDWRASHGAAGLQVMLSTLKPLLPADMARHLRA